MRKSETAQDNEIGSVKSNAQDATTNDQKLKQYLPVLILTQTDPKNTAHNTDIAEIVAKTF